MITATLLFPILFLIAACVLAAVRKSFMLVSDSDIEERMKYSKSHLVFFHWLNHRFSASQGPISQDFLHFTSVIALACYGITSAIFLASNNFFASWMMIQTGHITFSLVWLLLSIALIIASAVLINTFFHLFALKAPIASLKLFALIASCLVITFLWISFPFLGLEYLLSKNKRENKQISSPDQLRSRLLDLLKEMEEEKVIEQADRKLIKSVAQFGKLVVREIMIPRVDMVCLAENDSVKKAYDCFVEHGYSRVPVFKESIDHITGLLLYKTFMKFCFSKQAAGENLEKIPIGSLIIPILYAPENKRIRDLLTEIRNEKVHAAIVVNEYGCTEGLVTIEDIFEELLGSQIQDEYDEDEELLFEKAQDKSWIVDGRMSIVDAERELGITIPHNAEYETIAGFISWKMGAIPSSGTVIHEDFYNLRILESDKRQILKVRVTLEPRR